MSNSGGKLAAATLRAVGGTFVLLGRINQSLCQLRREVAAPQRADATHCYKVFHTGRKHRVGLRELRQT